MTALITRDDYPEITYLVAYLIDDNLDRQLRGYVVANGVNRAGRLIIELDQLLEAKYELLELRHFLMDTLANGYIVQNNPRATLVYLRGYLARLIKEADQAERDRVGRKKGLA